MHDGSGLTALTSGTAFDTDPAWQPRWRAWSAR